METTSKKWVVIQLVAAIMCAWPLASFLMIHMSDGLPYSRGSASAGDGGLFVFGILSLIVARLGARWEHS